MELKQYILKNLDFYHFFLDFVDDEKDSLGNYQNLYDSIENMLEEKNDFRNFLLMFSKIGENHHRVPFFIKKIEAIILHFQTQIKHILSNSEIFDIFKGNILILLFLLENKILLFDDYVYDETGPYKSKYYDYFYPEMKEYYDNSRKDVFVSSFFSEDISNLDEFNKKRYEGENDSHICKLIRSDSLDDFIFYINKNNYSYSGQIPTSNFETNSFLIKNPKTTLIEYAAFFGAIKIFQYLLYFIGNVNPRIWFYAIHGRNSRIIHILEDKDIKMPNNELCFEEAIKCHHNDIAQYIKNNTNYEENEAFLCKSLKYYNYDFIREEDKKFKSLFYFVKFKYIKLATLFLQSKNIKGSFLFDKNDYNKYKQTRIPFTEVHSFICNVVKKSTNKKYVFNYFQDYFDDRNNDLIADEFEIQMTHKYPAISKFKGICINSDYPIFLTKFYPNGTLNDYFKKNIKNQTDTRDYIILLGIAIGMKYLESNKILHGQLYPNYIFLDDNFYPIISQYASHPYDKSDPMKPDVIIQKYVIKYSSPEDLLDGVHSYKSNVFTYSLIAYQLMTKQAPFIITNFFKHAVEISKKLRPDISMMNNQIITGFFEKCFASEPENRMSFDEIIELITDAKFYSYFKCLDHNSVQKYLDIFGNEFLHLKNKF